MVRGKCNMDRMKGLTFHSIHIVILQKKHDTEKIRIMI